MDHTEEKIKELPKFVGNYKTHTLKRYCDLIVLKLNLGATFEVEYLFRYLNNKQQMIALEYINKKGFNHTQESILSLNQNANG